MAQLGEVTLMDPMSLCQIFLFPDLQTMIEFTDEGPFQGVFASLQWSLTSISQRLQTQSSLSA